MEDEYDEMFAEDMMSPQPGHEKKIALPSITLALPIPDDVWLFVDCLRPLASGKYLICQAIFGVN